MTAITVQTAKTNRAFNETGSKGWQVVECTTTLQSSQSTDYMK